jgi:histidyl-tRNA synthetase
MSKTMKTPRGTQDYEPEMFLRIKQIVQVIRQRALSLGAQEIDTPVLELTQTLLEKYGDEAEQKLIYRLQKTGKEELALRYDFTVPLQRYLEMRGLEKIKRFQAGKVYRKDRAYPGKGRFREFMQADFDWVGSEQLMVPEAEVLWLIQSTLDQLGCPDYEIRINFRKNLEQLVSLAEIEDSLFSEVCVSIDKLDKMSWDDMATELKAKTNDQITDPKLTKLKMLLEQNYMCGPVTALLSCLESYCSEKTRARIKFDAKLSRGLSYYTGMIYEVVLTQPRDDGTSFSTIVAGGRYDKLINIRKNPVPAIGVSFGVTRIEMILPEFRKPKEKVSIFLVSQQEFLEKKMFVARFIRDSGLKAEYTTSSQKNIKQINKAIKDNYDYILVLGENGDQILVKKNDQSKDIVCESLEELLQLLRS